ncbi:Gene late control D protein [Escherichia coli]|nr:Gene late control D protein [Escherichia coli]
MTDTTMQLLSQGTDPVKMPDFDILAEGKTLSGMAERLMSLSLTTTGDLRRTSSPSRWMMRMVSCSYRHGARA